MWTIKKFHKYFLFLLLWSSLQCLSFAQPFYYHIMADSSGYDIFRVNLQNNNEELFSRESLPGDNRYYVSWDPTQSWIYLDYGKGRSGVTYIDVINANDPKIRHTFPENGSFEDPIVFFVPQKRRFYDGVIYIPQKNQFYVSWTSKYSEEVEWRDFRLQKCSIYDAINFNIVDTIPNTVVSFTSSSSISVDGSAIYYERWMDWKPYSFDKFSTITNSIVDSRQISRIGPSSDNKFVFDSKNGKMLIGFADNSKVKKRFYFVYDYESNLISPLVSVSGITNAFLSYDTKYILIEDTPENPGRTTVYNANLHPGRISIIEAVSGKLIGKLQLPENGRILTFDNYPNMLYYYIESEQRSVNVDLSTLPRVESISPGMTLAGSGEFTLTVQGSNLREGMNILWNGSSRQTTYVSSSEVKAIILASDVETPNNALVQLISPDSSKTGEIEFRVVKRLPSQLAPALDCVTQNPDGSYTAWYGYENKNDVSVFIPIGEKNGFSASPIDRGQPTIFEVGKQVRTFNVNFDGSKIGWTLEGRTETVWSKSKKCP